MTDLISDEYREQLRLMRAEKKPNWGAGGKRHVDLLVGLIGEYRIKSVLDYGCGHGVILASLAERLGQKAPALAGYDPGIPERAALPLPAELVVSTDVLEHIEPDKLEDVLQHIRDLTLRVAYLHIHTGPANAILPDGRNAHLIQKPEKWWFEQLSRYFSKVEPVNATTGARKGTQRFVDYRPTFICE
jgi:hypothetical protein